MYFQHFKHRGKLALSTTSLDKSMCSYKGHLKDATKELLRKKSGRGLKQAGPAAQS